MTATMTVPTDKQREVLEQLAAHDLKITGVTQLGHGRVASAMARSLMTKGWATKEGAGLVITDAGRGAINGHPVAVADVVLDDPSAGFRTNSKRAPGKGRAAGLIEQTVDGTLQVIPLDQLHPATDNPRQGLGPDEDLERLAESMKTVGLLQPIVVTPRGGGGWLIVAGHRRHAAAGKAGLVEVPCVVRTLDDSQRMAAMLVENLQRTDLDPFEEARGYAALKKLTGWNQRQIGEHVGRNQATVSRRLKLLDLNPVALEQVQTGALELDLAAKLAALPLKDQQTVIDQAVRNASKWQPLGALVEHDLVKRETLAKEAAKRTASYTRLAEQGVKVVTDPDAERHPYDVWSVLRDGMRAVDTLGHEGRDIVGHDEKKCHAAAVLQDGRVAFLCTKPDSHPMIELPGTETTRTRPLTKEQQEWEDKRLAAVARQAKWDGPVQERRGWITKHLASVTKADVVDVAALIYTAETLAWAGYIEADCGDDLLGLTYGAGDRALIEGTLSPVVRAYAAALGVGEACSRELWDGHNDEPTTAHVALAYLAELKRIRCSNADTLEQLLQPAAEAA
jgi:ParB family chromosome partitioning protein